MFDLFLDVSTFRNIHIKILFADGTSSPQAEETAVACNQFVYSGTNSVTLCWVGLNSKIIFMLIALSIGFLE
jgi:hypothetical protein